MAIVNELAYDDFLGSGGLRGASEEKIDMSDVLAAILFQEKRLVGLLGFAAPADFYTALFNSCRKSG